MTSSTYRNIGDFKNCAYLFERDHKDQERHLDRPGSWIGEPRRHANFRISITFDKVQRIRDRTGLNA